MRAIHLALMAILLLGPSHGMAQEQENVPHAPSFDIPESGLTFETGDTWVQNGQRMRLYGIQSCIRGTRFTNPAGVSTDCGEASLAYLAALIHDLRPSCVPIAQMGEAIIVVCHATVGGTQLDVGTILVTQGFAFAAFRPDGTPVHLPYLVAELGAKKAGTGLWAAPDLPHPNSLLFNALKAGQTNE